MFAVVLTVIAKKNIHYKIGRLINIYTHNQGCVLQSVLRLHITSNVPANAIIPKRPASEYCFRYIKLIRAGRSGDRIPVEVKFSVPVQTGPEAHPASCTMGTGSFPGVRCGRGVTLTPHPLLVPRSKIE
jgi:hypothetical protein